MDEGQEPFFVNKRARARLFGVSEPEITTWIEDGCPVVEGGSVAYKFDVDQVRDWRKKQEEAQAAQCSSREAELRGFQQSLFGDQQLPHREGLAASETKEWLQAEYMAQKLSAERREDGRVVALHLVAWDRLGAIRQELLGLCPKLARMVSYPNLRPAHQQDETLAATVSTVTEKPDHAP